VINSLLLGLLVLASWVVSFRAPALITWSSSCGQTYLPQDEGDYFVVLSQWNIGISHGGLCVAQTHWAEFWSDTYGALDAVGLAYYEIKTEWPHQIRQAKVEAVEEYNKNTADMVKTFNVPTLPPATWWERLGITASNSQYDELHPANTCRGIRLPLWMIALVALSLPAHWLMRALRARGRWKRGHCVVCGYDLRGSTSRCPECGTPIAADSGTGPGAAKIPVRTG
jgi:hypothetical protein